MHTEIHIQPDIQMSINARIHTAVVYTHIYTEVCVQPQIDIRKLIDLCMQAVADYTVGFARSALTENPIGCYESLVI